MARGKHRRLKVRSVKFNVIMNMVITTSAYLFPLITIPYASRVLLTSGMGHIAFAQSVASYFALFAQLGITYYGVNSCAEVRDNPRELSRRAKELMVLLFWSTSIVTAFYIAAIVFIPQMRDQYPLFLVYATTLWLSTFGLDWLYQALEQYEYIAVRNMVFKLIAIALMFLLVKQQKDYVVYGAIVVFASYGSNIMNLLRLRTFIDFSYHGKLNVHQHLKPMFWFTVAVIASGMYVQVDLILLGFISTNHAVGLYQLASKIKSFLIGAVNAVGSVMLPRLSYYEATNNAKKTRSLMTKDFNFMFDMGFGIVALLIIDAIPIVQLMGGPAFLDSAKPLRFIGPAILFSAINMNLGSYIITKKRIKKLAIANVIGLAFATACNFVLIPRLGIVGSALSISLCEFLMLIIRGALAGDLVKSIWKKSNPLRVIVSAAVAAVATSLIDVHLGLSNFFIRLIGIAVIFGVLYLALLLLVRESFLRSMVQQCADKLHHRASTSE